MYLCSAFEKMDMKRLILAALLSLAVAALAGAQEIRTNYRSGKITHISTEYEELVSGGYTAWVRLEKDIFQNGSYIYMLYLNFEQKTSTVVPKGVKMAFNLKEGSFVRAEQIGIDNTTKRAYTRGGNKVYWNRTKYALEKGDMAKILRGVSSIDVVTGWNPDDYIQMTFPGDELSALLKRHVDAIVKAESATIDLKAELGSRANNRNNILTVTKPMVARGASFAYNVTLTHLYYKTNNQEDFDLSIQVGTSKSYHIALDSPVVFTLADGSKITLKQTRDEDNKLTVFPSVRDIRRLCGGISAISIGYEGGTITDTFSGSALSGVINQLYQLLMSVSER